MKTGLFEEQKVKHHICPACGDGFTCDDFDKHLITLLKNDEEMPHAR